jgi:sigma-B regulation protein RsbU (phosphoserine phosphatase)
MSHNKGEDALFVSSIIVLPLVAESRVLGVMSIVSTQLGVYFENADFDRCRVFADYATLTLENLYTYMQVLEKREIEQEVGIAADVQRRLVPSMLPTLNGSELSAFTKPARGVSGDYYDVVKLNDTGKVAIVVCDVAGKGVPASLVMVMIRTILHLVASDSRDAAKMVTWINRGIAGEIDIERFATLSIAVYDPQTRTLDYSNAAHHPAVLYNRSDGTVTRVDTEGLPVGLERSVGYGSSKVRLEPGDTILLFTDGITEALNEKREQYGDERLLEVFKNNATKRADDIVVAIRDSVTGFIGGARQHDDQTVLVLQAK